MHTRRKNFIYVRIFKIHITFSKKVLDFIQNFRPYVQNCSEINLF